MTLITQICHELELVVYKSNIRDLTAGHQSITISEYSSNVRLTAVQKYFWCLLRVWLGRFKENKNYLRLLSMNSFRNFLTSICVPLMFGFYQLENINNVCLKILLDFFWKRIEINDEKKKLYSALLTLQGIGFG